MLGGFRRPGEAQEAALIVPGAALSLAGPAMAQDMFAVLHPQPGANRQTADLARQL
jgi:hypothetical protein